MYWPSQQRKVAASIAFRASLLASTSNAHGTAKPRANSGLIGYGIHMYEPVCAFACKGVLSELQLSCSTPNIHDSPFHTSAHCFAENDAFLQSLAWCMKARCAEKEELWVLEKFWDTDAVGSMSHQPKPKYSYEGALAIATGLTGIAGVNGTLDTPGSVAEEDWQEKYTTMETMAWVESRNSKFGIILLLTSVLLPLFLAMVGSFLTSFSQIHRFMSAHVIDPALSGKRHAVPLPLDIGLLPTRGQAILISTLLLLNSILSIISYDSSSSTIFTTNANFHNKIEHFANRVGILSFANLPTIILYSGRNNPLINLTRWSYSTFLLYHRWVAYICVLQASLHSLIWFLMHIHMLPHKFTQAYWNAGIITALAFILIIPFSALFLRRRAYEFFLNFHVFLAAVVLAGCYYHINLKFEHEWGYENWIYVAILIWVLEKSMRAIKLLKNGLRTAVITHIDDEYIRVNIPDVTAVGYAYLYFPTLSWIFWANHPFSIASSVFEYTNLADLMPEKEQLDQVFELVGSDDSDSEADADDNVEAEEGHMLHLMKLPQRRDDLGISIPETPEIPHSAVGLLSNPFQNARARDSLESSSSRTHVNSPHTFSTGATFYIRRHKGLTSRLAKHKTSTLPVLVESSYHSLPQSLFTTTNHLMCIIGGAGITTVLPILQARASANMGKTVLYWGCRSAALVKEIEIEKLRGVGVDVHVSVGERWDVGELVRRETGERKGDVVVLVSGPVGMMDDVRDAIVKANRGRRKGVVRLVEEGFSW